MKVAVLSGKGGTGKTFVTVNLAFVAQKALYIDCDVEEPNGHLFLKPQINEVENIAVKIPVVNTDKCVGCRKCVEFCKFNALAFIKNNVKVYKELCHSCGGCTLVCPHGAITEENRIVGEIQTGSSKDIRTKTGVMNVGEASGVPIIRRLLEDLPKNEKVFIDCPPGSSCLVMESIKDSDFCILVTESTTYGIHNTQMVYELVKLFNKPLGIILNKISDEAVLARSFCKDNDINILGEFPYTVEIANITSNGELLAEKNRDYFKVFGDILKKVEGEVEYEAVSNIKR